MQHTVPFTICWITGQWPQRNPTEFVEVCACRGLYGSCQDFCGVTVVAGSSHWPPRRRGAYTQDSGYQGQGELSI